jgi:RNA polymerase sigma-70 factor (sigma-E family)
VTGIPASAPAATADDDFDAFVRGSITALTRFGRLLTADDARAQDVVQEALARCYLKWRRGSPPDDPMAYVRRAMVNTHASWWRRIASRERTGDLPPGAVQPGDAHADADLRITVWRALVTLPPRQRAVVVLRYYEGLTESETAAVLGCAIGTVKSQCAKALAKLRVDPSLSTADVEEAKP